jgi:hypothetical protein
LNTGGIYGSEQLHHHLYPQLHPEEEEEEGEVILPPSRPTNTGTSSTSRGTNSREGFHVTLGRNRSDIERYVPRKTG